MRAESDVSGVDPSALRDAMPDYLARISEALRSEDRGNDQSGAAWRDVASEHGSMRVNLGFNVEQLVQEFVIFRRVVVDVLHEEGCLMQAPGLEDVLDLLESGMVVSTRAYAESRDYANRRQEAEHISFITHELRNPVTTALLAVGKAQRAPSVPAEVRSAVNIMERSLRRIEELIAGVLKAERLEAGQVKAEPTLQSLAAAIEPVVTLARIGAEAKGLTLDVQVPPGASALLDAPLTRSALQNLLDNAIKYTDRGVIRLTADDAGGSVVVNVFDECGGIAQADLRHIFEPFHRSPRHAGTLGTGLGLTIARRAVEAQGGTLTAGSIEHHGCHFWFNLPKATPTADVQDVQDQEKR